MAKSAKNKKPSRTKKAVKLVRGSKTGKAIKLAPAGRRAWTDADVKALKTLVKQNTPTRLIAMKLKRSYASVYTKASSQRISLAPTNRSPRD